jgi:serine/threonine protein kinase
MVLTIESKNIRELSGQFNELGYNADEVFLKLARGARSAKFIGRSTSVEQGGSGAMFISRGIRGVMSFGELEDGQMEHLEVIHSILPSNSVKPIAILKLPEGTRPLFQGDRSANGNFGYLMEYVEGTMLSYYQERLKINRNSPSWEYYLDTFVSMAKQAIDLVNALNENSVAHGDFFPCNVMVSDGRAVLIDPAVAAFHKDPKTDMEFAIQIDNMRKLQLEIEIKKLMRGA